MKVKAAPGTFHGDDDSMIMPSLCGNGDKNPFVALLICWSDEKGRWQRSVYAHFGGKVHVGKAYLAPSQERVIDEMEAV